MATTFESGNKEGLVYSRAHLPTSMRTTLKVTNGKGSRVEKLVGQLEGGNAVVYPSGTAATLAVFMHYNPSTVWVNEGYKGSPTSSRVTSNKELATRWNSSCESNSRELVMNTSKNSKRTQCQL